MDGRIAEQSYIAVAGIAAFIVSLVIAVTAIPEHLFISVGLAAAGGLLASMYAYLIGVARRGRIPVDVPPSFTVENQFVRRGTVDRIYFYLKPEETIVHWISRRHVIWLLRRIARISLLLTVMVGLLVAFGVFHVHVPSPAGLLKNIPTSTATTTSPKNSEVPAIHPTSPFSDGSAVNTPKIHIPNHVAFPWEWLLVVGIVICIIVGVYQWINWFTWYFIVTNERLIILQLPFVVFPFANYKDEVFPLPLIKNAQLDGSVFQRRWGLARLDIGTYMQPDEDEALKAPRTNGLPHPSELEALINDLARDSSAAMEDSGSNGATELKEAALELKAAAQRLNPVQDEDSPTQRM